MNSLENVFARRAEKTSEAIYETVRDSWPARRCNLHDGLAYTCLACQFYRKKSCGAGSGNSHAGAYGQCLAR